MKVTYNNIKNSEEIRTYIKKGDELIGTLGFTEHAIIHSEISHDDVPKSRRLFRRYI